MKSILIKILLFGGLNISYLGTVTAGSLGTQLCILNNTSAAKNIEIIDVDSFDWEGDSRPDHNFSGLNLGAGQFMCRHLDVNSNSNPQFTILLNGKSTRMRLYAYQNGFSFSRVWCSQDNAYLVAKGEHSGSSGCGKGGFTQGMQLERSDEENSSVFEVAA